MCGVFLLSQWARTVPAGHVGSAALRPLTALTMLRIYAVCGNQRAVASAGQGPTEVDLAPWLCAAEHAMVAALPAQQLLSMVHAVPCVLLRASLSHVFPGTSSLCVRRWHMLPNPLMTATYVLHS
jgi:hypothetical protein